MNMYVRRFYFCSLRDNGGSIGSPWHQCPRPQRRGKGRRWLLGLTEPDHFWDEWALRQHCYSTGGIEARSGGIGAIILSDNVDGEDVKQGWRKMSEWMA